MLFIVLTEPEDEELARCGFSLKCWPIKRYYSDYIF